MYMFLYICSMQKNLVLYYIYIYIFQNCQTSFSATIQKQKIIHQFLKPGFITPPHQALSDVVSEPPAGLLVGPAVVDTNFPATCTCTCTLSTRPNMLWISVKGSRRAASPIFIISIFCLKHSHAQSKNKFCAMLGLLNFWFTLGAKIFTGFTGCNGTPGSGFCAIRFWICLLCQCSGSNPQGKW